VAARSKHDRLAGLSNELPGALFSPASRLRRNLSASGSRGSLKVQLADIVNENRKPCQLTVGVPPQMCILLSIGATKELPQIKNLRVIQDPLNGPPRNELDHRLEVRITCVGSTIKRWHRRFLSPGYM
jgi:hypothetical protein